MDRRGFIKTAAGAVMAAGVTQQALARDQPEQRVKGEPFSFAVIADPHAAEKPKFEPDRLGNHVERFLRCTDHMAALPAPQRPDFALVVGDIHIWELRKHLDRVSVPLHCIAGNHESGKKRKAELRDAFPDDFKVQGESADYYSFTHKGARFVGVCDAGGGGDHIGHLCSEDFGPRGQCEWLESELAQTEAVKVVFSHIPTHPQALDQNMYLARNDAISFNDQVTLTKPAGLFFGHMHRAMQYTVGQTPVRVVQSCAWNFGDEPLGYDLIRVGPDGLVATTMLMS
ncbi:MAG: hypothetical protein HOH74_19195 [Gemmatimonadetes bacterium]|nr:hypothetical protein [Gemmatimonadota bacterium]